MSYSKLSYIHTPHNRLKPHPVPCQPTFRTGAPQPADERTTPWNDLCDEVLVPLGSLFLVFLVCGIAIWLS